jgi:hypothetical protein
LKESQNDGESKFAKASGDDKSNLPMDPAQKKKVNQLKKKKTREPPAVTSENGFSTDSKTK